MNNNNFILKFIPKLIDIQGIELLRMPLQRNKVLVYGEIHGIQENADVVYSLVHQLGIKQIALENSPDIARFIHSASEGVYDFSLIDIDTFDMSIDVN